MSISAVRACGEHLGLGERVVDLPHQLERPPGVGRRPLGRACRPGRGRRPGRPGPGPARRRASGGSSSSQPLHARPRGAPPKRDGSHSSAGHHQRHLGLGDDVAPGAGVVGGLDVRVLGLVPVPGHERRLGPFHHLGRVGRAPTAAPLAPPVHQRRHPGVGAGGGGVLVDRRPLAPPGQHAGGHLGAAAIQRGPGGGRPAGLDVAQLLGPGPQAGAVEAVAAAGDPAPAASSRPRRLAATSAVGDGGGTRCGRRAASTSSMPVEGCAPPAGLGLQQQGQRLGVLPAGVGLGARLDLRARRPRRR